MVKNAPLVHASGYARGMTQSTACDMHFEVTDDMRERHARFVAEMTRTVWEMWEESGDVAAHPEQAARWIRVVESEWAVDAREGWMHPMRSIAVRVQMDPEEPPRGADRLDWFDAWRTWEGLHEHDRITWTARCLGLTLRQSTEPSPQEQSGQARHGC